MKTLYSDEKKTMIFNYKLVLNKEIHSLQLNYNECIALCVIITLFDAY